MSPARPYLICILFLFPLSLRADPPHASPPDLHRSLIVSGQGYFPVALRLQDNRIAIILRGGAEHLGINGRLDIVFSDDDGQSWTRPAVVADSPADDRNPAFGQAADGTLIVAFWRTARYDAQGRYTPSGPQPVNTWLTRSTDAGRTWSEPAEIDVSDITWGSPYGRILTLSDGSMLMNIYGGPDKTKHPDISPETDFSYLYRSTDHGRTWRCLATISPPGYNETALLSLPTGRLLAAMRSEGEAATWLTHSDDDGKSWSPPRRLTPAKTHPADLTLLPDSRILLTVGHRAGPFGVRACISDAAGDFDWSTHFSLVDDATNTDCGYPSTILLPRNRALTAYYAVGSKDHPDWAIHCAAITYPIPPLPGPKRQP